jgi:phage terminase large subunit
MGTTRPGWNPQPEEHGPRSIGASLGKSELQYAGDPEGFIREVLGDAGEPYAKQQEIIEAVLKNRRVSVVGCNGSGKDWTVARIILWWIETQARAKVVVTGPTQRQVQDVVWREMRTAFARSRTRLAGRMLKARYEVDEERFAIGFATDAADNLQGFHSPNLLGVVTEAHGVDDDHIQALKRLNPRVLLLTGNPLRLSGEFYESHHGLSSLYARVAISAFDTPNLLAGRPDAVPGMLTPEDVAERLLEWGEDHPLYVASVLGQFPEALEDSLISRSQVDAAISRWKASAAASGEPWVMGVDVARYGRDKTVLVLRRGPRVERIYEREGIDTMQIVGRVLEQVDRHGIQAVYVDGVGIGSGVIDRLREQGKPVVEVQAASVASSTERFVNLRAELFWELRRRFAEGDIQIPDDADLAGQLLSLRYEMTSSGRVKIERKPSMKARGLASPDKADALALAFMADRSPLGLWL